MIVSLRSNESNVSRANKKGRAAHSQRKTGPGVSFFLAVSEDEPHVLFRHPSTSRGKEGRRRLPVASKPAASALSIHPRNFSQKCDSVVVAVVVPTGMGRTRAAEVMLTITRGKIPIHCG